MICQLRLEVENPLIVVEETVLKVNPKEKLMIDEENKTPIEIESKITSNDKFPIQKKENLKLENLKLTKGINKPPN